jgi:hypothetical protein
MKDNIEFETIKLRLEGTKAAVARFRFAFLVSMIASGAILVTAWNAYLSPESKFALQPNLRQDKQFTPEMEMPDDARKLSPENTPEANQVQREIISEWVKNRAISVSLLGVRVSVEDFPVLGSLGLLIIVVWLSYSIKIENINIGNLLKHAYGFPNWEDRYFVFEGLTAYLMVDLGHSNKPIESFEQPTNLSSRRRLVPPLTELLLLLPALTIMLIIAADIWTLFFAVSPFYPSAVTLWRILDAHERISRIAIDSFACFVFLPTARLCFRVRRYEKATGKLVVNFRNHLLETYELPSPSVRESQAGQ